MATIGKIKVGDTIHDIAGSIQYIEPTVKSAGSSTSGAYEAAKWAVATINGSTTLTEGMTVAVRTPGAGTKGGILLSIDNGTTYKPLALNVNTMITTHYGANSTLLLTYNSKAIMGVYATSNAQSSYTGCWQISNYDSNTNTVPAVQCETSASTAAKVGTCTNHTLLSNSYVHVNIRHTNTNKNKLTLNIDSAGAKDIWLNGSVTSSTNYNLKAGTYIVYYDGTVFHFRDDGKLPGTIMAASSLDANGVAQVQQLINTAISNIAVYNGETEDVQ